MLSNRTWIRWPGVPTRVVVFAHPIRIEAALLGHLSSLQLGDELAERGAAVAIADVPEARSIRRTGVERGRVAVVAHLHGLRALVSRERGGHAADRGG